MVLSKEQIEEISLRRDRFLYLIKEGESSGGLVTYRQSNMNITTSVPHSIKAPIDRAYTQHLKKSLEHLLELTPTTQAFKDYVADQFLQTYNLGGDFTTVSNAIKEFLDPLNDLNRSPFNPEFAEELERIVLITVDLGLRRINQKKYGPLADRWKEELNKKYKS